MSDLYASESGFHDSQLSKKAAIYLRTATTSPHQLIHQVESISAYAKHQGIEIVATYEDYGKGGLTAEGWDGLQQLMQDVCSGGAPFSMLLMQDFSQWGRFQDIDGVMLHYEHDCYKAGIEIVYVEQLLAEKTHTHSNVINALRQAMSQVNKRCHACGTIKIYK